MCVCVCVLQHFIVNTHFIEHNRHFLSTYFLLDPFVLPYCVYRIRGELIYVLSIVVCIPITFCPTLGHHRGRIYYKSDIYIYINIYIYIYKFLFQFLPFSSVSIGLFCLVIIPISI